MKKQDAELYFSGDWLSVHKTHFPSLTAIFLAK